MRYITALLFLLASGAAIASWTSTRYSQADWQCQNADGTVVSSHQRQDKAFESCVRESMTDGVSRFVVGGTYRIDVTLPEPCPVCAEPEPCPTCPTPEPCPSCPTCPMPEEPPEEPPVDDPPAHEHPPHDHHGGHGHMGPHIDVSTIPVAREGFWDRRVRETTGQPRPDAGRIGAVRTVCERSHFNFDDPLVYPGAQGASHLHMWWGNTAGDAFLTADSILGVGNSTCRGGIANRSAYWMPAIIDTTDGAVIDADVIHVYYKTGYRGVADADVDPMPTGFRMIVGDMNRTTEWQWGPFEYRCNGARSFSIPECNSGELVVTIHFPQCWDGVNLYRDDQSHVRRASGGCPASHPIALPEVSYNVHFPIPAGRNAGNWRLSSDMYDDGPGGYSMHADLMIGWEPHIMPRFVREIINEGLSGGSGLIGGGEAIY